MTIYRTRSRSATSFARDIHRARRCRVQQRIGKADDMRARCRESTAERAEEIFIRRIIRPKGEDSTGMQMRGESVQPFCLIEDGIARVQQTPRRMIDIQQHRVKQPAWLVGIESVCGERAGEK